MYKHLNKWHLLSLNFQKGQSVAPLPGALQEAEPAVAAALHPGRNCPQPRGGQRYVCLWVADVVMITPAVVGQKVKSTAIERNVLQCFWSTHTPKIHTHTRHKHTENKQPSYNQRRPEQPVHSRWNPCWSLEKWDSQKRKMKNSKPKSPCFNLIVCCENEFLQEKCNLQRGSFQ